jgi:hypothetical protein
MKRMEEEGNCGEKYIKHEINNNYSCEKGPINIRQTLVY